MNRTSKLFALALIISASTALVGCAATTSSGNGDAGTSAAPAGGGITPNSKTREVTDYGQCSRGARATSIEGAWGRDFAQGEITFSITLDIQGGSTQISNECHLHGRSLTATAWASSYFSDYEFVVTGRDKAHEEINEAGFNMNCDVEIQPYKVEYSFRGSCLVMKDRASGQELVLVRR